ncbi:phosphotransferase [Ruegeria sp. HKCCSP351]|uniref:phosphotransferase enzyme family protein n=1 Tax=Ruegeria sp. HKCCSP351 TaxID=2794832 RepID=UPI001AE36576|nr:phosphotransferase [Ruegeria sp. HKCCSP351]
MTNVELALSLWGLENTETTLIAERENAIYRVDTPLDRYVLRLHRRGYRTDAQLQAELAWMAWLDHAGLSVPAPVPSLAGPNLQFVSGTQVDILTWLDGKTLDVALLSLPLSQQCDLFFRLGQTMAQLHDTSDHWPSAKGCDRPHWDIDGLVGKDPMWGRFWDNPGLTPDEKALFLAFRTKARDHLTRLSATLDYGLIHADLVPGNVMCSADALHLIDFDDGGFGFRVFELATALLKHRWDPGYPAFKAAMIDGYTRTRPMNTNHFLLFLALRAATYVGWNITRADEDPTQTRNARFIAQAKELAVAYLERYHQVTRD